MKHSENTSENALKADAFTQQVASNLAATLQRFNELQAQIQALQITQKTSNVLFTSLITPPPSPAPVTTAPPVMVPGLIGLGRQSRAALGNHVQRYWLGVSLNIK